MDLRSCEQPVEWAMTSFESADEMSARLGFVPVVRTCFSALEREGFEFVERSPSRIHYLRAQCVVAIWREPHGHEVAGIVRVEDRVATFEELADGVDEGVWRKHPTTAADLRSNVEEQAAAVLPTLLEAFSDSEALSILLSSAKEKRAMKSELLRAQREQNLRNR